jgi:hypothetical protein
MGIVFVGVDPEEQRPFAARRPAVAAMALAEFGGLAKSGGAAVHHDHQTGLDEVAPRAQAMTT